MTRALTRLREAGARAWWYVRELNGEHAYDRYVAHARSHDPHVRVLSRREFENRRIDRRDADPREGGGCC
ncbi:CstA-like transporter-associated (seleno)protein [Streptomyces fragilis]|uniref:YbdD/YjiX family protein n=1 Tax=Streptomyces fragilis TaxID=67301 RepID=A0ABV2YND8_9ACTN|nr:YbdD/YjiX family protein [Streptomyces fragilis]